MSTPTIPLYWARIQNWGDQLSKVLIERFSEKKAVYSEASNKYVIAGSIIDHKTIKPGDIIWGTGCMWRSPQPITKGIKICAVRGPLTRKIALKQGLDCPEIFGDPGLLMRYIFTPEISSKYKIGLIPHYIDYKHCEHLINISNDLLIIDITKSIKEVINAAAQCDIILSSSLHGLILGDSLGKSSAYIKISDKVCGGNFKFEDYILSTGRKFTGCCDWRDEISDLKYPSKKFDMAITKALNTNKININLNELIKACPFNTIHAKTTEDIFLEKI